MSVAILPDGSVVFHLAVGNVVIDVPSREVQVRPRDSAALGLAVPFGETEAIHVDRGPDGRYHLRLEIREVGAIDLGGSPAESSAMHTAWAVADATRCKIEVDAQDAESLGPAPMAAIAVRRGSSASRAAAPSAGGDPGPAPRPPSGSAPRRDPLEDPTSRIDLAERLARRASEPGASRPTAPTLPDGPNALLPTPGAPAASAAGPAELDERLRMALAPTALSAARAVATAEASDGDADTWVPDLRPRLPTPRPPRPVTAGARRLSTRAQQPGGPTRRQR
jgi:hypothetical protein